MRKQTVFARFLAALLIAGQLVWGLAPARADTLRQGQEAETHQTGLEERLSGKTPARPPTATP